MNETIRKYTQRRSVRAYEPEPVKEEDIQAIIEAGLYAASGMGRQPAIVIAVTDRVVRDALAAENARVMGMEGKDPFYGAPAVLCVLADRSSPTYLYDGSLMLGNMMNAAYELGLGSCWIHRAKEEFESETGKKILADLGIEGDYEGIGNLIIGYAAEQPQAKERKAGRAYYIR